MDDEFEDKLFYQTYTTHMKLLSKFAIGLPSIGGDLSQLWRLINFYIFQPSIFVGFVMILLLFLYIYAIDVWSRCLLDRIRLCLRKFSILPSKTTKLNAFNSSADLDGSSWEFREKNVAVYAIQGRRAKMEDRFVVNENINGTGVNLYAVFDGHGGEFAANYARDNLINNLHSKIIDLKNILKNGGVRNHSETQQDSVIGKPPPSPRVVKKAPPSPKPLEKKPSFKRSVEDAPKSGEVTDPFLLEKLGGLARNNTITREAKLTKGSTAIVQRNISSYLDGSIINFGRLVTDEVLAADRLLLEVAKKNLDLAGTTALLAIVEGSKLIVANVGDSRGVMCDSKGKAIPLSFDHKPQQTREKKRIEEAGGSVCFNGVWRVAGILATSRAMGDYPLKDRKLVIADPDVLTFDLKSHKPKFVILASDGLWDMFTNEEAIAYISSRLNEPHFGAKSITLQAYYKGSLDNITVLIINLLNHNWS